MTWLYGPLHIGHDWTDYSQHKVPKLHRKTSHDELPSYKSNSSPSPAPKKPILKRRSISQLLSLPASPFFHHDDSDDEEEDCHGDGTHSPARPPLVHTKSDTHISMRGRPFRKDSPPRIIAEDSAVSHHEPTRPGLPTTASSEASGSTGSDQDLSGSSSHGPDGPAKKKHISFNTFVEQCIAIEKPKLKRSPTGPTRGGRMFDAYDDGLVSMSFWLMGDLQLIALFVSGTIRKPGTMGSTTSRRRCTTTTTMRLDQTRKTTMTTMSSRCERRHLALAPTRRRQCGNHRCQHP